MTHEPDLTERSIRRRARELVRTYGANEAARQLGIGRNAALSLASHAPVRAGTIALVREYLRNNDASQSAEPGGHHAA